MTEEEAKTKWCPFVRLAAPVDSEAGGTAGNRWPGDDPVKSGSGYLCISSSCMAWRVRRTVLVRGTDGDMSNTHDGYCGLAGGSL